MKKRTRKKRLPIEVVGTEKIEYSYSTFLWTCAVTALFLSGNLLSFFAIWKGIHISRIITALTAALGVSVMMVTDIFETKDHRVKIVRFLPLILFIILGPVNCWEGMRVWLNQIISGWNHMQDGGIALFAGVSSDHAVRAFLIISGIIFGEMTWYMVTKARKTICWLYTVLWILIMLAGGRFEPVAAACLMSGLFGACLFMYGMPIRRNGLGSFVIILIVCMAGAFWFTDGKLEAVEQTREDMVHGIHELRYGKDQLPEGKLAKADQLQKNSDEMMRVTPEQKKSLYLKAYVGSVYKDGVWKKMPDSTYGGKNAGLLRWLKEKQFDPLTQSARYLSLSGKKQRKNYVRIQIKKASRYYFYTPDSLTKVIDGKAKNKMDAGMLSKGIFGQRKYEWTEVSSSRPAELIVADEWVSTPKNAAQKEYSEAEAVYRKFVYDNYTKADAGLLNSINKIFWKDYKAKSDGIYSALTQVRMKLKEQFRYTKTPEKAPEGQDPLQWFLTSSRTGNQMLYASAAVEAFRAHGIPARYVEGYYLGASKIQDSKNGEVSITGENAHAWVEVYFDGVGWKAVDVTPGYYYNVATLQKMINTPEQIKKNAALKNNGYKGKQTAGSGKSDQNLAEKAKKAVKHTAMILLGVITLLVIIGFISFVILELRLWMLEQTLKKQYEQAEMNQKIRILQRQVFGLLGIFGIETKLGWKTKEMDQKITDRFANIEAGDYERACELMEKTIYGGIKLELFEERTVRSFRDKLVEEEKGLAWKEKLKLRYQFRKYCM